jgi:hypothetical protein
MWNNSCSPYLICYHGPRDIIECYEFNVELIAQMPTSMHGSKEGHTGYIYRRTYHRDATDSTSSIKVKCDPLYSAALEVIAGGVERLKEFVDGCMNDLMSARTSTRSSRSQKTSNCS